MPTQLYYVYLCSQEELRRHALDTVGPHGESEGLTSFRPGVIATSVTPSAVEAILAQHPGAEYTLQFDSQTRTL